MPAVGGSSEARVLLPPALLCPVFLVQIQQQHEVPRGLGGSVHVSWATGVAGGQAIGRALTNIIHSWGRVLGGKFVQAGGPMGVVWAGGGRFGRRRGSRTVLSGLRLKTRVGGRAAAVVYGAVCGAGLRGA